jgi:PAS domain S-box-containing protein
MVKPTSTCADSTLQLRKLRRLPEVACQDKPVATASSLNAPNLQAIEAANHELHVHQIELTMQNEELRRVGAELETARKRYYDLYDLAPTGFCTLSDEGVILEANLAATSLLGVSRSALMRQALSRFVQPDDLASYYQWRKRVLQDGLAQTCELRMKHSTGAPFWASLNATASVPAGVGLTFRVVLSDITGRKNAEVAFQEAQLRLRQFTLRQQEEFDALRMELAHDVHDQLGQTLASLKFEIDGIRETAPSTAARMQALITRGVNSIRDISRALRPIALELGLIHALNALVAQFSERNDVNFVANLPKGLPSLSGPVERGLYRIAQEALINAVLHAQATEIRVNLRLIASRLELEVCDDGLGYASDAPSVSQGLGLTGMREPAHQLGANLSITSGPADGTRVFVSMQIVSSITS